MAESKDQNINNEEDYEKLIRRHKRKIKIITVIILAFSLAVFWGIKYYLDNMVYEKYEITDTYEIEGSQNRRFYKYGDGILVYSDDGIYYKSGENVEWNQSFEMKSPIVDICNETVAICDNEGNKVYIYNIEGSLGEIETAYPILDLEVSDQGVVATITKGEDTNIIEVMDKSGNVVATGQTYLTGEGLPIDISLSDDGTKLAASYIYIDGGKVKNKVVFYNYSEIGKNEVGRIVGGFNHYEETVIPKIEFIDNDTVIAFGDDTISRYYIEEKPSLENETRLNNEVKSIFYNDDYYGVVMETGDYDAPYKIKLYEKDGTEKLSMDFDFYYTDIVISGDEIMFNNENDMRIINVSGVEKYNGEFLRIIKKVIPTNKKNVFYIVDENGINRIEFK